MSKSISFPTVQISLTQHYSNSGGCVLEKAIIGSFRYRSEQEARHMTGYKKMRGQWDKE